MNDEGVNRETAVSVFTFSKLNVFISWKFENVFFFQFTQFSLFLSCFFLSVSRPGLRPQPSSSTSCLCKDPATVVVSIVHVQTPWCRCIRSLLPVPSVEAGGSKDYEISFPESLFYFFNTFFFLFCPNWCFLFSSLPPPVTWKAILITHEVPLSLSSPKSRSVIGVYIRHRGTVMDGKAE